MGSICYVAATAKEDKYLWLGGPLMAGMAVVALSGLAPLVLPVGSRALAGTEAIWLYGGLAVISGFTLYDVQKVMNHARLAQAGRIKKDAVNEAVSLELDFINMFIRILQVLAMRDSRRR
jgi:FtsH-binding integral membrane protein